MRANVLVALWVVAATAVTALAGEKRAFEIADDYRTAFVGAPELSPDGLRVVVAVTRYDLEKGESWSELSMMGIHGSIFGQMTQGRHHDSNTAFSPEGSLLAFESDRAGEVSQLFVIPVNGGEPPPWDVERFLHNQGFGEGVILGAPPFQGAGSD
jgi:dipeptidyl aminopeptidase/acylaminoacyl peptidase